MTVTRLVLLGGGGHASDVLGVLEECNLKEPRFDVVAGYDTDPTKINAARFKLRGVSYETFTDAALSGAASAGFRFISAIGYPEGRLSVARRAEALGLRPLAPIVHPGAAWVATGVSLGEGTIIHAGASIGVYAALGRHCYVSHGALIGHDSVLGDGAAIMPGASLSGGVRLGASVMVGSGAVILEGIRIGNHVSIGANAVVTRDVADGEVVTGVPARPRNRA